MLMALAAPPPDCLAMGHALLVMRRFHLPSALVFLQAGTMLAIILTTLHAAIQTEFGAGITWKGRTYQFVRGARGRIRRARCGEPGWRAYGCSSRPCCSYHGAPERNWK